MRKPGCSHAAARGGEHPHLRLGDDYPTAKAAEYCDGLVEVWATEIAVHADFLKPVSLPHKLATEATHWVRRHALRGEDPDTAREIREEENLACRAGMRNPMLRTARGERPELRTTMGKVATLLRDFRTHTPSFQNLTGCFGSNPSRAPS